MGIEGENEIYFFTKRERGREIIFIYQEHRNTEIFLQREKEGLEKAKSKYQIKTFPFFE